MYAIALPVLNLGYHWFIVMALLFATSSGYLSYKVLRVMREHYRQ